MEVELKEKFSSIALFVMEKTRMSYLDKLQSQSFFAYGPEHLDRALTEASKL